MQSISPSEEKEHDGGTVLSTRVLHESTIEFGPPATLQQQQQQHTGDAFLFSGKVIHYPYNIPKEHWLDLNFTFPTPSYAAGAAAGATNSSFQGLPNLRNRCFLNSTLQALSHSPGIISSSTNKTHTAHCNLQDCGLCVFENFINNHISSSSGSKKKLDDSLYKYLMKHKTFALKFSGKSQACAYEFLTELRTFLDDKFQVPPKASDPIRHTSYIGNLFTSTVQVRTTCQTCGFQSDRTELLYDHFIGLQLKWNKKALPQLLRANFQTEKIEGLECEKCCGQRTKIFKRRMTMPPNNLVVVLNRRSIYGGGLSSKAECELENFEELDLSSFLDFEGEEKGGSTGYEYLNNQYHLYAGIVHKGSHRYGHYICVARPPNSKHWVLYDDEDTTKLTNTTAHNILKHAYVLFYTRAEPRPHPYCKGARVCEPLVSQAPLAFELLLRLDGKLGRKLGDSSPAESCRSLATTDVGDDSTDGDESVGEESKAARVTEQTLVLPSSHEADAEEESSGSGGHGIFRKSERWARWTRYRQAGIIGDGGGRLSSSSSSSKRARPDGGGSLWLKDAMDERQQVYHHHRGLSAATTTGSSSSSLLSLLPGHRRDEQDREYDRGRRRKLRAA